MFSWFRNKHEKKKKKKSKLETQFRFTQPSLVICASCSSLYLSNDAFYHQCIGSRYTLSVLPILTPIQQYALQYVHNNCVKKYPINDIRSYLKLNKNNYKTLINKFNNLSQVINFHIEHIQYFINDNYYRNCFETGITSGCKVTSLRNRWENSLFNYIYQTAYPYERCKYGTINLTQSSFVHEAEVYGDCYFILKPEVKNRSTFTMGDSSWKTVPHSFAHPHGFFKLLHKKVIKNIINGKTKNISMNGTYIETQIHGSIQFNRDILAVVVSDDKKYSPMLPWLSEFCKKNNIIFQWRSQII